MPSVWHEKRGRNYRVFWYAFHKKDVRSRVIGPDMEDVVAFEQIKLRQVRRESLGLPPLPEDEGVDQVYIRDFMAKYVKDRAAERGERTVEHFDKPAAGLLVAFAGDRYLASLTPKDAHDFKVWMLTAAPRRGGKGYGANTTRMFLRSVKTAFAHALQVGQIKTNPFKGLPMPPAVSVGRVPTNEELSKILDCATPELRDLAYFLVHQGCRRGDAANLDWRNLEVMPSGRWRFSIPGDKTKNRRDKVLVLHSESQRLLVANGGPRPSGSVFPHHKSLVDSWWRTAKKAAGITTRLRLHDLKVKFVNAALDSGLATTTIMEATGNLSQASLGHYIKQGQSLRHDQIDRVTMELPQISHSIPTNTTEAKSENS